MRKKMSSNEFRWPFAKHRLSWIAEADRISNDAADLYEESEFAGSNGLKKLKRSASLYEHAAEFYKKAGLGLASQNSYWTAAEVWENAGDDLSAKHCEEKAMAITTFWGGDDE